MEDRWDYFIPTIILNIIIILINAFLLILFCKSKSFKAIPCYNMLIFSLILFLDSILRIIPVGIWDNDSGSVWGYIQAFFLVMFDKLILANLTNYAIIYYYGVMKPETYFAHEKKVFLIPLFTGIIISAVLSAIYISNGILHKSYKVYYYAVESKIKQILDPIYNAIYYLVNLYCCLSLLIFTSKKRKEAKAGISNSYNVDYNYNFIRILILFIINTLTFIESYILIYVGFGDYSDIVYLATLLILDIYNISNKMVYKESRAIFCNKIDDRESSDLKDIRGSEEDDKSEELYSNPSEDTEDNGRKTEGF